MSKVQKLRSLVNQRLTAAAEEIFGLFERTIAEYEEELSASREENERQRRLLDAAFNPEVRLHRADVQQLLVKGEVPPEQQDWTSSLDQEDPEPPHIKEEQEDPEPPHIKEDQEDLEPPHIKEEQEDLWTSQEGEQLQGLEEAGIRFSFNVKSEDDDKEDCGGPESDRMSDPERHPGQDSDETSQSSGCETCNSRDWVETLEPQSDLNLQNNEVPERDVTCSTGTTSISWSECDGSSDHKSCLKRHSGIKTVVKLFKCSFCDKRFGCHSDLKRHVRSHTGEKPFSCSVCGKRFSRAESLKEHLILHTGKKPFSCSVCGKKFSRAQTLKQHFIVHTGEEPFSCSVCGRIFARNGHLKRHMSVHTGEKPFQCSVCGKTFTRAQSLKRHLIVHTGKTN